MAKIVNASGQFVKFRKEGFVVGTSANTETQSPEKSLGMRMTPEDWKTFGKWFAKNKKSLTKKPKAPKAYKSDALGSVHTIASDLHAVGFMSEEDKATYDKKCLKGKGKGKKQAKSVKNGNKDDVIIPDDKPTSVQ